MLSTIKVKEAMDELVRQCLEKKIATPDEVYRHFNDEHGVNQLFKILGSEDQNLEKSVKDNWKLFAAKAKVDAEDLHIIEIDGMDPVYLLVRVKVGDVPIDVSKIEKGPQFRRYQLPLFKPTKLQFENITGYDIKFDPVFVNDKKHFDEYVVLKHGGVYTFSTSLQKTSTSEKEDGVHLIMNHKKVKFVVIFKALFVVDAEVLKAKREQEEKEYAAGLHVVCGVDGNPKWKISVRVTEHNSKLDTEGTWIKCTQIMDNPPGMLYHVKTGKNIRVVIKNDQVEDMKFSVVYVTDTRKRQPFKEIVTLKKDQKYELPHQFAKVALDKENGWYLLDEQDHVIFQLLFFVDVEVAAVAWHAEDLRAAANLVRAEADFMSARKRAADAKAGAAQAEAHRDKRRSGGYDVTVVRDD